MGMAPIAARQEMPIRLIVLNHNGGEMTLRCLRELVALDWPADQLEIVCLDNDSSDGSLEQIERELPQVDVRRLNSNKGFPANNEGLRDLDSVRYVGLVNNDAFVEPDWLQQLVDVLDDDPGLGAVCPKILLEPQFVTVAITSPAFDQGSADRRALGVQIRSVKVDGIDVSNAAHLGASGWGREFDRSGSFEWSRPEAILRVPAPSGALPIDAVIDLDVPVSCVVTIDGGGGPFMHRVEKGRNTVSVRISTTRVDVINNVGSIVFADGYGADRGWLEIDEGQYDHPVDVFAWCGGGVLFRTEFLHDVGLFHEPFFLYYEDTDLSWRGQSRGWRYRTVPRARMRHIHAASTGEVPVLTNYLLERNRLLMVVRNAPTRLVLQQVLRYPLTMASYLLRDVVQPIVKRRRPSTGSVTRRLHSYFGFLRLLLPAVKERRDLRSLRVVTESELEGWLVPRG